MEALIPAGNCGPNIFFTVANYLGLSSVLAEKGLKFVDLPGTLQDTVVQKGV